MPEHCLPRPRHRRGIASGAALLGLALMVGGGATSTAATAAALPTTDQQLVTTVKQALENHDLDALDALVDWDGATPMRRRLVVYQMRFGFGRPIRSITLEPFPQSGFDAMKARGKLMANMPVTDRLRVVFDEPNTPEGQPPGIIFLIGRQQQAYRIALVVPVKTPDGLAQAK